MIRIILGLCAVTLTLGGCASQPAQISASVAAEPATAPSRGLVSAADPRAAEAGAQILRAGGSATDAAIATMLALTVVEPQSSGIGGGGFYLRTSTAGEIETIDGRETAPAAAGPDWFLDDDGSRMDYRQAVLSGLSIGVPGNIRLASLAHKRHGKLPWAQLFGPAITLARDGFEITPRFREFLSFAGYRAAQDPAGQAMFFDEAGEPLPAGTTIYNEALATTLERIAANPDYLYRTGAEGGVADTLATAIAAYTPGNAAMTPLDITSYEAKWRSPVCGDYRSYRICGMGPPSSGATTVFAILKQLEHFDLTELGPDSPVSWHLFAESQRLAYADRGLYLADSDFVSVPVAGLTDDTYLTGRGALISATSRMASVAPGTPDGVTAHWSEDLTTIENGTSHFVTVDSAGNAVSYTSTIEGPFGSGLVFEGFFLNNELTDFSFVPEVDGLPVANRVEGGKRPRSSMAPTIVLDADGAPILVIGAAGGGTIPVQVAKALIGVLDWKLSAQDAIALPGLYSPGDTISIEPGSSLAAMTPELEALGHTISERRMPFKANAAQLVDGNWIGAADPRSEGAAIDE